MVFFKSLLVFLLAGLCEIGGGYLIWLWLKEGKPWWLGLLGGVILAMYGVVATLQPANFGRVYAAYGGVFIAMAVLWGWKVEGIKPDKWDVIGAVIAFIGMAIIMFAPRK
ncbi:MAG: YnfA family protein [Chitinophagaceae bacterium]|nr:MAG: YnfA family protein [Chitinophagaceae bacterium]